MRGAVGERDDRAVMVSLKGEVVVVMVVVEEEEEEEECGNSRAMRVCRS